MWYGRVFFDKRNVFIHCFSCYLILLMLSLEEFSIKYPKLLNELLRFLKSLSLIVLITSKVYILSQTWKQLANEWVVHEFKKNWLYWVKYAVLSFEDLLYQNHVMRGTVFLLLKYQLVYIRYIPVVLWKLDLPLNRKYPLIKVILRLGAQNVFSVLVFDLEAVLVRTIEILQDVDWGRVAQHYKVEVFVL